MDLTKIRDNNALKTTTFILSIIGAVLAGGTTLMNLLFVGLNPGLYKIIIINVFATVVLVLIALSTKSYNSKRLKIISIIKSCVYVFTIIQMFISFTFSFSGILSIIVEILCFVCLAGTVFFMVNDNPLFASYSILAFCALNLLLMLVTLVIDTFSAPGGIITYLTTFITGVAFNILPIAFVFLPQKN